MTSVPRVLMFMQSYYSVGLHRGIAQYASEVGWHLNASMYRNNELPQLKWHGVIGCFQQNDPFIKRFIQPNRLPAVSLTQCNALPCVLPDNRGIGSMSADHLLELGYKHFASYFWQSSTPEILRAEALQNRLNPTLHTFSKINFRKTPRIRSQSTNRRLTVLKHAIKQLPKPVAILAPFDDLAVEVMEVCLEMGLNVPKDVGILGVNNDALICEFTPIPLSSVDNNEFRIGFKGAALLDKLMRGEPPATEPILINPKRVEVRKSTDLLDITHVPDRPVARAVRFIADHYMEAIQTQHVAAAAGISKRALQDRFALHMGRSVHEQIILKRIECARFLLKATTYKTTSIALESGFASRERFSVAFKQATGMNPSEFRNMQT